MNTITKEARPTHSNILSEPPEDELTMTLIREIMELTSEQRKELWELWKEQNSK